ncbi:MAG: DNA-directed RNA polymerase, partial [Pseudomonadota bacterium]
GAETATEGAARQAWRQSMRLWREGERRRRSKAAAYALALRAAERFQEFERLYLPHSFDFRGRLYAAPRLNPQGADPVRALLEFAEGKPLGEEGWKWLAIHLANCGDFEKISKAPLADRVRWVFKHEERIRAVAADPRADLFWTEADKPWQFLAACFEWADYVELLEATGEAEANRRFRSRLPVALDGTCSGLQHFSLMLRDEGAAAAVNLTPAENPEDLYGRVAERLRARLEGDAARPETEVITIGAHTHPIGDMARAWLAFGVDRALVKRPTMTFGYGARTFSYAEQILADTLIPRREALGTDAMLGGEAGEAGEGADAAAAWPFPVDDPVTPAVFLASRVAEAIESVVVKAAEAANWLQALADHATAHGAPLIWTTPDGFRVAQAYRRRGARLVHARFAGRALRLTLREEGTALDGRRQRQGVAPNVIHALDACHLRMTLRRAAAEGIDAFALVHDSFGVHAVDTPRFFQIIREAMVALYRSGDVADGVLRDIRAGLPPHARAGVPAPPSPGAFDVEEVLGAEYAFA